MEEIIVEEGGERDKEKKEKEEGEEAEEGEISNTDDGEKENVKKAKKIEKAEENEETISVKESDDNTSQHTEVIDDSSEMEVNIKMLI